MPMVHVEKQLASGNSETVTRRRDKDREPGEHRGGHATLCWGCSKGFLEEVKSSRRKAGLLMFQMEKIACAKTAERKN